MKDFFFATESLKGLVGVHNAKRGSIKFFEAMQDIRLNKQLFYVSFTTGICVLELLKRKKENKKVKQNKQAKMKIELCIILTLKS